MKDIVKEAANIIKNSSHCVAFTGAGISVESGIPPFRGEEGLWSKYDPEVLDINFFHSNPTASWNVINKLFYDFFGKAKPNKAHFALAELEKAGIIKCVITQNIDNLHQEAGSAVVWEFHGNSKKLVCLKCDHHHMVTSEGLGKIPPLCPNDQSILKPDFVFFGESIPERANNKAFEAASITDVLIIVGSTGEIMPANMIPGLAKQNSAKVIEINTEPSN